MERQETDVSFIADAIRKDARLRDLPSQLQGPSPEEDAVIVTFNDYFSQEDWRAEEALPRARTLLETVQTLVAALEQEVAD